MAMLFAWIVFAVRYAGLWDLLWASLVFAVLSLAGAYVIVKIGAWRNIRNQRQTSCWQNSAKCTSGVS